MRLPFVKSKTGHLRAAVKSSLPRSRPKLLLHVGSHKTGTTSIQFALANNRDYLRSVRVWYPKIFDFFSVNPMLPSANAHFAFASAVADFRPQDRKRIANLLNAIHESTAEYDKVILSAESIYRHRVDAPFGDAAESMFDRHVRYVDRLAAVTCGFDTEALLYLRSVDRFAPSLYAEAVVRTNTTRSFQDFLKTGGFRFDYRSQIDLFSKFFRLKVKNFEASAKSGLLETFCQTAGIPGPLPPTADRPRPSVPNTAALWLVRAKAEAGDMDVDERNRRWHFALLPVSADVFENGIRTGFWIDRAERDAFIAKYQSEVPEVDFPPIKQTIDPLVTWSDTQHRAAERLFRDWEAENQVMLRERERNLIPPHALEE